MAIKLTNKSIHAHYFLICVNVSGTVVAIAVEYCIISQNIIYQSFENWEYYYSFIWLLYLPNESLFFMEKHKNKKQLALSTSLNASLANISLKRWCGSRADIFHASLIYMHQRRLNMVHYVKAFQFTVEMNLFQSDAPKFDPLLLCFTVYIRIISHLIPSLFFSF